MAELQRRCCDTCGKRSEWKQWACGKSVVTLAECLHRPLPSYWTINTPLEVMPGCGTQCASWNPAPIHSLEGEQR